MKPSRRNLANVARLEEKLKGPVSKYALKRRLDILTIDEARRAVAKAFKS